MRRLKALYILVAVAVAAGALPVGRAQAQPRICFAEVPDCIEGRFAEYWQQNGGLPVFGFPISPAAPQQLGGGTFLVQTFERNRFELHPENPRPYDVLLGRLGDDRLRQLGRPWENEPKAPVTSRAGCVYFGETGHLVCAAILSYWRSNGLNLDGRRGFTAAESLALFGLPLTEASVENGSDGRPYLTQWFERARFEVHPELGPNVVLLGLLGRETSGAAPQADSCDGIPPSVSGSVEPICLRAGDGFTAVGRGFKGGERIGFYATAPDQSVVELQLVEGGASADRDGVFGITARLNLTISPGIYAITFEGISSGHRAVVYFKVLAGAAPPPPADTGAVPPGQSATATPASGPRGTVFRFVGRGFQPGEQAGVYLTAPDQSVIGAPFQASVNDQGLTEEIVYRSAGGDQPGVYAITFEGVRSKHRAVAYFRITP